MTVTTIIVFSTSRDKVHNWSKSVQKDCKDKGVEVRGPKPLPRIATSWKDGEPDIQYSSGNLSGEGWFHPFQFSKSEVEALFPESGTESRSQVFGRALEIADDEAAASVFDNEVDEEFFFRVSFEKSNMPKGKGNQPAGYDPNWDYVTDVDFDAHHRS